MSDGTPLFGGLHIDLTDSDPVLSTVHQDGELSIDLTGREGSLSFYLTGTPDELHWLCDKLRAIVTAHESSTKLAGEAAREVANDPLLGSFDAWLKLKGIDRDKLKPAGLEYFRSAWATERDAVTA